MSTAGSNSVNWVPVWVGIGTWILFAVLSMAIARIILENLSISRFSQSAKRALYVAVVLFTSGMIGLAYLLPNAAINYSQIEDQNLRPSPFAAWTVYGGLALFVCGLLVGLVALTLEGILKLRRR